MSSDLGSESGKINQKAKSNNMVRYAVIITLVLVLLIGSLVAVVVIIGMGCD